MVFLVMEKLCNDFRHRFTKITRSIHFRYGLPFMIFVVGGSFVLKEFAKVRYEFSTINPFKLPAKDVGLQSSVDVEEEYKKLKEMDIDNWESVRVDRPWESGDSKPKEKPIISQHPKIRQQAKQ